MGRKRHCTENERNLIKKLRKQGKTYKQISQLVGRSENMITNALKHKKNIETRGRPKKTTKETDRYIARSAKRDPFISSVKILKEIDSNISSRTVRRRLQENNLHGRSARKVPLLSKKNIIQRIKFAKQHMEWNPEKWRNLLWSDESKFNLFGSDGRTYVRRPPNKELSSKYTKKTVKHGGGNIMVWACFSWHGVGPIHWIRETMMKEVYRDILSNVMFPYADENMPLIWLFQQDNDPKHTSKCVKQ